MIAVSLSGGLFIRARFERGEPIRKTAAGWTNRAFYLVIGAVMVTVAMEHAGVSLGVEQLAWALFLGLGGMFLLAALASTVMMRRASIKDRDFHALLWLDLTIAHRRRRHVRDALPRHGARHLDGRRRRQPGDLAIHLPVHARVSVPCHDHVQLVPDLGL